MIHKTGNPPRPIVASITYNPARYLADLLSPLVGNTEHHIINSAIFVDKIKHLETPPPKMMVSIDISVLFSSIPVPAALVTTKKLLEQDQLCKNRTTLRTEVVMDLLKFCLTTTFIMCRGTFCKQVQGAAMGSLISLC